MDCLSELTCALYADGELDATELRRVETHLAACKRCRTQVEALRAENRALAAALLETEPAADALAAPARTRPADLLWTTALVLLAAVVLNAAQQFLTDWEPPGALDWVNPFSVTVQWNLFFSSIFYFIREGATMVLTSVTFFGGLSLVMLLIAGTLYWLRRRPTSVAVLVGLTLVLGLAQPGAAIERRSAKKTALIIPADQTIDDTLVFTGETLILNGTVTGNVIAFAERVEINGTVQGDVICFAGKTLVEGNVGGNLMAFTSQVDLRGHVARSLYGFASVYSLGPNAVVEGDAVGFSGDINVDGNVGRDLTVFGGHTSLRGKVGRNVYAHIGRMEVLGTSQVGGDLTAYVKKADSLQIDPGASIAGKVTKNVRPPRKNYYLSGSFYFWRAVRLAAALITGLVLFWLFPALYPIRPQSGGEMIKAVGIGFLMLVAVPVGAVIVGITLVGLPIGLVGLATWLTALYLAKIFVGGYLGQRLLAPPASAALSALALPLLAGLVVVFVAINLPYVGGLIHLLALLLGLGLAFSQARSAWKQPASTA